MLKYLYLRVVALIVIPLRVVVNPLDVIRVETPLRGLRIRVHRIRFAYAAHHSFVLHSLHIHFFLYVKTSEIFFEGFTTLRR